MRVLESSSKNFRSRSRTTVNEYYNLCPCRNIVVAQARVHFVLLFTIEIFSDHWGAFSEEVARDIYCRLEISAGVTAQIDHELARSRRFKSRERIVKDVCRAR